MPRTGHINYRLTTPDPLYHQLSVAKLINKVMKDGKKTIAQAQVYAAFEEIKTKTKKDPLEIFDTAIQNITPQMEVRSRRVGGAAYQVPMPVRPHRASSLAIRWLVTEARNRSNSQYHSFAQKLAAEILDAAKNEGSAINRKLNVHRQAEANKAFAHFRW